MVGMDDESPGGGAVETDRAAVFSEYQRAIDYTVCSLRTIAFMACDPKYANTDNVPAQIQMWNVYTSTMGGEKDQDIEDVEQYSDKHSDLSIKIRMRYCFKQMNRGDLAVVGQEVADLWLGAGIAYRISEEEFAKASAIIEANAQVPAHPAVV